MEARAHLGGGHHSRPGGNAPPQTCGGHPHDCAWGLGAALPGRGDRPPERAAGHTARRAQGKRPLRRKGTGRMTPFGEVRRPRLRRRVPLRWFLIRSGCGRFKGRAAVTGEPGQAPAGGASGEPPSDPRGNRPQRWGRGEDRKRADDRPEEFEPSGLSFWFATFRNCGFFFP